MDIKLFVMSTMLIGVYGAGLLVPAAAGDLVAGDDATYASIPVHGGLHNGGDVLYIITDSSDAAWAGQVGAGQGWQVAVAPPLLLISADVLNVMYVFANGTAGGGLLGHQGEVFLHTPENATYTSLSRVVEVSWLSEPGTLGSAADINLAASQNQVTLNDTGIIANAPHVSWPGGQMAARAAPGAGDGAPNDAGQAVTIDHESMRVSFVAHRGWGPDGSPVWYVVTGASGQPRAADLGVARLLPVNNGTADAFVFANGPAGPGLAGFQQEIFSAAPGSEAYSPVWLMHNVTWAEPQDAHVLSTIDDLNDARMGIGPSASDGMYHTLNAPIVDPFQNVAPVLGGVDLAFASPPLGSPDAPVTIIKFGDYQCPKCKDWFTDTRPAIHSKYIETGKASMYFLDLAFIGPDSFRAAAATYCAQEQGMYWEFHDTLYGNQEAVQGGWASHKSLVDFAEGLGMDTDSFEACMEGDHQERIEFNRSQAALAGLSQTPSFVIVGDDRVEKISGNQPAAVFERVIGEILP